MTWVSVVVAEGKVGGGGGGGASEWVDEVVGDGLLFCLLVPTVVEKVFFMDKCNRHLPNKSWPGRL